MLGNISKSTSGELDAYLWQSASEIQLNFLPRLKRSKYLWKSAPSRHAAVPPAKHDLPELVVTKPVLEEQCQRAHVERWSDGI